MVTIREERDGDVAAVWRVNEAAFARPEEADLVNALRQQDAITASLVAEVDGAVVGHILFSPATIVTDEEDVDAVALGPMAVLPDYQGQGIGSRLVRAGLARCRALGHEIAVVLGHPWFYPRFGFAPAGRYNLRSAWEVPDEAFMALALVEGALPLPGRGGVVHYRPAFDGV